MFVTPVTPINLDSMIDRLNMIYKDVDQVSTISSVALGKLIDKEDVAKRMEKVVVNKQKLQKLLDLPKMEQRTPVWYEARQTMITASDFAQALGKGKFGTQKQFFQKKCGYEKDSFVSIILQDPFAASRSCSCLIENGLYASLEEAD